MSSLNFSEINLYGKKILCVDDLIASGNSLTGTDGQNFFLHNTHLREEDVFFADAYEPALKTLEEHPEIGLAFVDLRIPQRSEDLTDYNPEDPTQGWGSTLLKELVKRYQDRGLEIIIITAYALDDLSDPQIANLGRAFFRKPLDYDLIIDELQKIVARSWKYEFDYDSLDLETSSFVREKTDEIKVITRRMAQDALKIGQNLTEIKAKLGHGNYEKWVSTEFPLSKRMAQNFTAAYKTFKDKSADFADLEMSQAVLFKLSETLTTDEAREEALQRAEQGEKITLRKAQEIQRKYLRPNNQEETQAEPAEIEKGDNRKITSSLIPPAEPRQEEKSLTPKLLGRESEIEPVSSPSKPLEIIGIQQNIAQDSYWYLGKNHRIFCGEPKNQLFLKLLPEPINLTIGLPPDRDLSLIPQLESEYSFNFCSKYYDPEVEAETIAKIIEEIILNHTDAESTVVFSYIFDPRLLELADRLDCKCYVAEPDLSKCDRIIKAWQQKTTVSRIKL